MAKARQVSPMSIASEATFTNTMTAMPVAPTISATMRSAIAPLFHRSMARTKRDGLSRRRSAFIAR